MVKGLEHFKKHFSEFTDCYVLIGGTACTLAMNEAGLDFRATKDLDIVLCIEVIDKEFGAAFWQFINDGGYEQKQKSTGKKLFYRFYAPTKNDYPEMLELFSRVPEALKLSDDSHLTPIPIDDEISSLSAILLDNDYYHFVQLGKREIGGLSVLVPSHLIPLKARAWIDFSQRHEPNSRDTCKHKNDVVRLYKLLSSNLRIELPESIKKDMGIFLDYLKKDERMDLKNLDLENTSLDELCNNLGKIYNLV